MFQEIAFQVWRSIDAFTGKSAASTWIYRVALNTALAWDRTEKRREGTAERLAAQAELLHGPEERDPRLDWIYEKIAELNDVDRSLCLLMLDGFSYREISQILGISESNVGVKLNRLKEILSNKLESEESHES